MNKNSQKQPITVIL